MTTNKLEVVAWRWRKPIVNDKGETIRVTHWVLGETPEFLPWWTNDPLIRLSDYEILQAECDALRDKTSTSIGVGDGTGNLFVHGDYDSIKRVQELIFECEKLRKDAGRLAESLEELIDLMEDTRQGEYIPDSFTTQPARIALEAHCKGGNT